MKYLTLAAMIIFTPTVGTVGLLSLLFPNATYAPTSSTNANQATQPTFTATQVSQHAKKTDCYLIVKGAVYDVTSYIGAHPGGAGEITSRCGGEVTSVFTSIHSNAAWNLLGKYEVGKLQ